MFDGIRIAALAIAMDLTACAVVFAGSTTASCPPSIAVEQKASAPDQWSVDYSKDKGVLSSITIFEGPPQEQASLKYDDERTAKDEIIEVWKLPKSERGYWMQCGYANTTAQLSRKLPDAISSCKAVLEKGVSYGGGGAVVKRASCSAGADDAKP
jgi:hypothetical protein